MRGLLIQTNISETSKNESTYVVKIPSCNDFNFIRDETDFPGDGTFFFITYTELTECIVSKTVHITLKQNNIE